MRTKEVHGVSCVGRCSRLVAAIACLACLNIVQQGQADDCIPPPTGLIGWWPGDGHVFDLAGTNHGVGMNGATFATGMVSQAFSFGGLNDFVNIPSSPVLDLRNAVTLEAWIKPLR